MSEISAFRLFHELTVGAQLEVLGRFAVAGKQESTCRWLRSGLRIVRDGYGLDGHGRSKVGVVVSEIEATVQGCCRAKLNSKEVDELGLSRFLNAKVQKPRNLPIDVLILFMLVAITDGLSNRRTNERLQEFRKDNEATIKRLIANIVNTIPAEEDGSEKAMPELEMFRSLLDYSLITQSLPSHDFLRNPTPWPRADETYYVLYRYSTNLGAIVKTFLVVQSPLQGGTRNWSFQHFIKGGREFSPEVFRIGEGVVLAFRPSYFLLGFTFSVDATMERTFGPTERANFRRDVRGIELIAVEEADIKANKGLFAGIVHTQAALGQPVAARVACLYLGSRSTLGKPISHLNVRPDEIADGMLESDLAATSANIQSEGVTMNGSPLAIAEHGKAAAVQALAAKIRTMIDNTPAWERSSKNPNRSNAASGRGALETYAKVGRPRP